MEVVGCAVWACGTGCHVLVIQLPLEVVLTTSSSGLYSSKVTHIHRSRDVLPRSKIFHTSTHNIAMC